MNRASDLIQQYRTVIAPPVSNEPMFYIGDSVTSKLYPERGLGIVICTDDNTAVVYFGNIIKGMDNTPSRFIDIKHIKKHYIKYTGMWNRMDRFDFSDLNKFDDREIQ